MNDTQINALVAEPELKKTVISLALKEMGEEVDKKKVEQAKKAITFVKSNTQAAVNNLRHLRRQEADAKATLVTLANAEKAFLDTGDIETYIKTVYPLNHQKTLLNQFRDMIS